MSFLLMAKALNIKTGSSTTKLVLLKLCDNANDDGECWPSQSLIADQCELSRRTVITSIQKLEELGYLASELIGKNRRKYSINLSCENASHVKELHTSCENASHLSCERVSQAIEPTIIEPIKEPIIYKSSEIPKIDPVKPGGYYEFLEDYPKVGKWDSANLKSLYREAVHELDGHDVFMMSVKAFKKYHEILDTLDQFIPNPEKWLKEGRYRLDWDKQRLKAMDEKGINDWSVFNGLD